MTRDLEALASWWWGLTPEERTVARDQWNHRVDTDPAFRHEAIRLDIDQLAAEVRKIGESFVPPRVDYGETFDPDYPLERFVASLDELVAHARKSAWVEDELDECDKRADKAEARAEAAEADRDLLDTQGFGVKFSVHEEMRRDRDRLADVLHFYADEDNWEGTAGEGTASRVEDDGGSIARAALSAADSEEE